MERQRKIIPPVYMLLALPKLGRSLIHREGVALIRDWISSPAGGCPRKQ